MNTLILPLLISCLTGAAMIWSLCGSPDRPRRAIPLQLCVSLLTGLLISSLAEFLLKLLGAGPVVSMAFELFVLAATLAIGICSDGIFRIRRRGGGPTVVSAPFSQSEFTIRWLRIAAVSLALLIASGCLYQFVAAEMAVTRIYPHGDYDAWQFWNLRARFIHREVQLDERMFAPPLNPISHPLLLPLTIVRAWRWHGADAPEIAAAVSVLFGTLTPLTLFAGIFWLRDAFTAALATTVLLSSHGFPVHSATQLADAPISVYMVAAIFLAGGACQTEGRCKGLWILAGLMTGATAWMKNEGLLFSLLMSAAVLFGEVWRRGLRGSGRTLLAFSTGLMPVMLFVVFFRMVFTSPCPPELGHELSGSVTSIFDKARHAMIWDVFRSTSPRTFHEAVFPWCLAYSVLVWIGCLINGIKPWRRIGASGSFSLAVAGSMVMGYYTVLLVTPHDLNTLLCSTLFRLLLQLWPLAVTAFFLCMPVLSDVWLKIEADRGKLAIN